MKPIKRFCFDGNITYYGSNEEVLIPEYLEKDQELRGVWFSTVANIDIPKMSEVNVDEIAKLKNYLLGVIDKVSEYNLNTVVFQVRPLNDALYQSDLNPWSRYLTGVEGQYPGFDVFGFFVEEALKKDIITHAWINPYRAGRDKLDELGLTVDAYLNTLSENNFARLNPDCIILTKDKKILLDPANPKVMEFVSDSVIEVSKKYNIKAVHIDDYFYPYEDIDDPLEEEKMKQNGFTNRNEFRRDNVNKLIEMIHNKLTKLDKKIEFGISPFGVYRTNKKFFDKEDEAAWEHGSNNHPGCFTCYKGLYADIYYWMEKGWIDYVVPQNYFDMDNTKVEDGVTKCLVKYCDLAKWWSEACLKTNVKLYMGQGLYRCSDKLDSWSNSEEIPNQLRYNQTLPNNLGTVFFTYKDFVRDNCSCIVDTRNNLKKMWTKKVKDL